MNIQGLTDGVRRVSDTIPRGGKARKGDVKPKDAKKPGEDLDYFRVTLEGEFKQYQAEFDSIYTTEPRHMENMLVLGHTPETVFPTCLEKWTSDNQLLLIRVSGDAIVKKFNIEEKRYIPMRLPATPANIAPYTGLRAIGRLKLVPIEFCREIGRMCFIQWDVTSKHEMVDLSNTLKDWMNLYGEIPRRISIGREIRSIQMDNGQKTWMAEKSLIYIRPQGVEVSVDAIINRLETGEVPHSSITNQEWNDPSAPAEPDPQYMAVFVEPVKVDDEDVYLSRLARRFQTSRVLVNEAMAHSFGTMSPNEAGKAGVTQADIACAVIAEICEYNLDTLGEWMAIHPEDSQFHEKLIEKIENTDLI